MPDVNDSERYWRERIAAELELEAEEYRTLERQLRRQTNSSPAGVMMAAAEVVRDAVHSIGDASTQR